jgi:flagellar hook-length control protein FliK
MSANNFQAMLNINTGNFFPGAGMGKSAGSKGAGNGFMAVLDSLMERIGSGNPASEKNLAALMNIAGTPGRKTSDVVSMLAAVIKDGDMSKAEGRFVGTKGLEALGNLLEQAGFDQDQVKAFIDGKKADMETGYESGVPLNTLLPALGEFMKENDHGTVLDISALPFVQSALNGFGIPSPKVEQIIDASMGVTEDGKTGIDVEKLLEAIKPYTSVEGAFDETEAGQAGIDLGKLLNEIMPSGAREKSADETAAWIKPVVKNGKQDAAEETKTGNKPESSSSLHLFAQLEPPVPNALKTELTEMTASPKIMDTVVSGNEDVEAIIDRIMSEVNRESLTTEGKANRILDAAVNGSLDIDQFAAKLEELVSGSANPDNVSNLQDAGIKIETSKPHPGMAIKAYKAFIEPGAGKVVKNSSEDQVFTAGTESGASVFSKMGLEAQDSSGKKTVEMNVVEKPPIETITDGKSVEGKNPGEKAAAIFGENIHAMGRKTVTEGKAAVMYGEPVNTDAPELTFDVKQPEPPKMIDDLEKVSTNQGVDGNKKTAAPFVSENGLAATDGKAGTRNARADMGEQLQKTMKPEKTVASSGESSPFQNHAGERPLKERLPSASGNGEAGAAAVKGMNGAAMAAKTADAVHTGSTEKTLPAYVTDQVARQISKAVRNGDSEIRFHIRPPEMGRLELSIANTPGGLKVSIMAEHSTTRDMLMNQSSDLKTVLADQGIRIEKVEVGMSGNFGQGMAQTRTDSDQPGRNRKQKEKPVFDVESLTAEPRENPVGGMVGMMQAGRGTRRILDLVA